MNLLSKKEVAAKLGMSPGTLNVYRCKGKLPGLKFTKLCDHTEPCKCRWYVKESDLNEFLESKGAPNGL